MSGVLGIFLQRLTIALLIHSISHVTHCVYILTKALLVFILLLKIAYLGLMVGGMESCTCVTYIAKSKNGSMETTNQTSWSRSCTYVEGGWWNAILLLWISLSFIWITWGHGYICIYFFSFFHGHWCVHFFFLFLGHASWACHLFSLSFFDSPCLIWKIVEREIIKHGVLFCGWMEWHSWLPV